MLCATMSYYFKYIVCGVKTLNELDELICTIINMYERLNIPKILLFLLPTFNHCLVVHKGCHWEINVTIGIKLETFIKLVKSTIMIWKALSGIF